MTLILIGISNLLSNSVFLGVGIDSDTIFWILSSIILILFSFAIYYFIISLNKLFNIKYKKEIILENKITLKKDIKYDN